MKVICLGYVWPEPQSSAAGIRQMNVIEACSQADWDVVVASSAQKTEYSEDLESRGIKTQQVQLNDISFDAWLKSQSPDVVVFDQFLLEEQFGARVQTVCPEAARVVDTQDLHFVRLARKQKRSLTDATDECLRELASLYRSDLNWVVSGFEKTLLIQEFGVSEELIRVSRIAWPDALEQVPTFSERRNFVFIGNFRHPPNADAMKWMYDEIWPQLRARLPEAQLHIYGAYPLKELMALDSKTTGFRMMGRAESAEEILKAYRVNLAPLRFGAGIKGKILDGWRVGLPVVSTSVGAEGLMENHSPWGGKITDSVESFVDVAVRLYETSSTWKECSESGIRLFQSEFSRVEVFKSIQNDLKELVDTLALRRSRQWVGKILWSQAFRSTEYFSRWIEVKERLKGLEHGGSGR